MVATMDAPQLHHVMHTITELHADSSTSGPRAHAAECYEPFVISYYYVIMADYFIILDVPVLVLTECHIKP
eukprot:SAG31_NODE_433_length_15750_cov_6.132579_14_plen_71_part_00